MKICVMIEKHVNYSEEVAVLIVEKEEHKLLTQSLSTGTFFSNELVGVSQLPARGTGRRAARARGPGRGGRARASL